MRPLLLPRGLAAACVTLTVLLALQPTATAYDDLLSYLSAVGNSGKNFAVSTYRGLKDVGASVVNSSRNLATSTYEDILDYFTAVHNRGKKLVSGLLAPRFDVRRALELLRSHLRKPWPAVGLPCFDPLDVLNETFELEDLDLGSWSGSVERTRLVGLADFVAEELVLEPMELRVSFNFTWPRLHAFGRYTLNGSFAHRVPTRGRGPFNVTLWDLRLWGDMKLGSENPTLQVRELHLGMALGAATGRMQGLRGAGAREPGPDAPRSLMVSNMLSETTLELAPEMVSVAGPRLSARLAAVARNTIDRRLRDTRAASANALSWARAVATERFLSLTRGAPPAPPAPAAAPAAPAAPPASDELKQPSEMESAHNNERNSTVAEETTL